MLHYAVVFFVIAIIAAILGFGGIAGAAVGIAKILFFVFLVLALLSLLGGSFRKNNGDKPSAIASTRAILTNQEHYLWKSAS